MMIVRGSMSGAPILLLPEGYAYLRVWCERKAGEYQLSDGLRSNKPYTEPLTDEEEALAMKLILTYG